MELSVIIPVWNDLEGLERLLRQIAKQNVISQIIISDDCSDVPPGPETLSEATSELEDKILWLYSSKRLGAGHARNVAIDHVRGTHVIFFDSDDLFGSAFSQICASASLESNDFDFIIFRHDESRMLEHGSGGNFPEEEKYWKLAKATPTLSELDHNGASELCRISAYPWNKIYRTQFLRDNAIRCTETMVHNDFELHWSSFIVANRILSTTLTGAIHYVEHEGLRLTNRRDAYRLEVFHAFENILQRLSTSPEATSYAFLYPFFSSSFNLICWIRQNISDQHQTELLARAQRFFLSSIDRAKMISIAYADPNLASKINQVVLRGILP